MGKLEQTEYSIALIHKTDGRYRQNMNFTGISHVKIIRTRQKGCVRV